MLHWKNASVWCKRVSHIHYYDEVNDHSHITSGMLKANEYSVNIVTLLKTNDMMIAGKKPEINNADAYF